ncbi:MAG: transposase, partial [Halomonas sp.]
MPRPKRNFVNRGCYHITHRCHGGNYIFKFAKHRQLYFEVLRETVDRFAIDVLNYIVTSNHTHLLLWARRGDEVSRAIQFLHGRVGQEYNKMKKRQGAFWTDRHHATLIQSGSHLSKCLFYIDF